MDIKQLEEEYITTVIEKIDNHERKRVFASPSGKEVNSSTNLSDNSPRYNVDFNMKIAMLANEKLSLMLTTDQNEETFECDTPAESEDSYHD